MSNKRTYYAYLNDLPENKRAAMSRWLLRIGHVWSYFTSNINPIVEEEVMAQPDPAEADRRIEALLNILLEVLERGKPVEGINLKDFPRGFMLSLPREMILETMKHLKRCYFLAYQSKRSALPNACIPKPKNNPARDISAHFPPSVYRIEGDEIVIPGQTEIRFKNPFGEAIHLPGKRLLTISRRPKSHFIRRRMLNDDVLMPGEPCAWQISMTITD